MVGVRSINVGDRFKTNRGGDVVVIEYNDSNRILVQFDDEFKHTTITDGFSLRRGILKNPYARLLFGVGYHGIGEYKSKYGPTSEGHANLPVYQAWTNMLSRCYNPDYNHRISYDGCSVHPDWHCYQAFAEWYINELKYTGWEGRNYLDKDILGDGTLYSKDTCCLVPMLINVSITSTQSGKYARGVIKSGDGFRVAFKTENKLPKFRTEQEAHEEYLRLKHEKIRSLANEYKDYLNPVVYDRLKTKDFTEHLLRKHDKTDKIANLVFEKIVDFLTCSKAQKVLSDTQITS